jgi:tRNA modification GTPase
VTATIFACSSGRPPAAIAVVRISGPRAADALSALAGTLPPPRMARLRALCEPQSGQLLDHALILWFPGPASATGEDLAELHLHGGRAVVAAVEAVLSAQPGLRAAQPGEFTRRAFLNGRIDLAEAEGLADLLEAETESQRAAALAAASGHVSRRVATWQGAILEIAAGVEALLDFADEDDVAADDAATLPLRARSQSVAAAMREWLARPAAERIRDGLSVVVAGPPNAGKSTLINALAQREAAIVSPIAGTTRDIVEVPLQLGGIAMRFADTAGLRGAAGDSIEAIGIDRANQAIESADIILWLGEVRDAPSHRRCLTIAAQADRHCGDAAWAAGAMHADLILSAHSGEGMALLHDRIVALAKDLIPREGEAALHARQRAALAEAADWLEPDDGGDAILFAERLRLAQAALDRITGRAGVEDMLDALFGRFCIGK